MLPDAGIPDLFHERFAEVLCGHRYLLD